MAAEELQALEEELESVKSSNATIRDSTRMDADWFKRVGAELELSEEQRKLLGNSLRRLVSPDAETEILLQELRQKELASAADPTTAKGSGAATQDEQKKESFMI